MTPSVEIYTVGPLAVRAYLVSCPETKEAFIIDPAGDEDIILNDIKALKLDLKYIINTHGHADHTCGNHKLKALVKANVMMHKEDDEFFRRPDIAQMFRDWGFEPHEPVDIHIKEGDEIKIGKCVFKVLHTPGHSPGSVCLLGHNMIFTGDSLFVGAVGRTDLPGGSFETLINSLKTKIVTLPDETIVYPGHDYGDSPTSTIAKEKRTNPYITDYCR